MNNYGKLGTLPPTKQELTANVCPMVCGKEGAILCARPPVGVIANWWSRCQRCLCYWETDPAGKIVVLRAVETWELCPDCREEKVPTSQHVCTTK